METPKVIKVGNSKCFAIPHLFCKKMGVQIGQRLECSLNINGEMIVKVPHKTKEPS